MEKYSVNSAGKFSILEPQSPKLEALLQTSTEITFCPLSFKSKRLTNSRATGTLRLLFEDLKASPPVQASVGLCKESSGRQQGIYSRRLYHELALVVCAV